MKKLGSMALLAGALMFVAGSADAKTKVVIGKLDWSGATAIEAVLSEVMTRYLDADVETISAAQEALYDTLAKGDGAADIVADMWTDHLPAQMKNYVLPGGKQLILLNTKAYLGTEGIFVPTYVADMGVKSITDLDKPEIAKLFDSDGNGKGEIWAGEVGWESTNQMQIRAKSYGFDKTMESTTVATAAFLAQLKDAIAQKKPIAFYYWTPEWIHAAFKLTKLEEPAFDGYTTDDAKGSERYKADGCYTFYQPASRNDWLEASSIKCGQPPTRVNVAFSKALADRAPKIGAFLKNVAFKAEDVNAWILAMEVDKKDVKDVAKAWVDANKDMIEKEWLKGAM